MKTLSLQEMEQVQAQGWFGCAISVIGLGAAMIALGPAAPVAGAALVGLLTSLTGVSISCVADFLGIEL